MQRIIHMLSYSIFFSLWICSHITLHKWRCWVPAWKRNVFVQSWKYHCLLSLYALLFYHNILECHHGLLCQSVPHRVKIKSCFLIKKKSRTPSGECGGSQSDEAFGCSYGRLCVLLASYCLHWQHRHRARRRANATTTSLLSIRLFALLEYHH